jgi:outer membrane protein OmpA-like peptidoglycan-associated protein
VYTGLLGENPRVVKIEKSNLVEEAKNEIVTVQTDVTQAVTEPVVVAPTDGSKPFLFKIRSIDAGRDVEGDIDIFDADIIKGRKVVSYRGNDVVNVKPINKSGNIVVVCDVFGYRKVQLPLNFNEPKIEDGVSIADGNIVVNFDLVRLKKGDKVVMYNVYFFNHAAIMRPESRFEVNALLELLKERPTSKIRIHGHANGNDFGKIITLGKSDDYFSLSPGNSEGKGSVTKLSEERARIIQSFLVKEGIDIDRMELKAWGGKMPIYDEDHSLAHANVRVEVEILEE